MGSEMCIRDSSRILTPRVRGNLQKENDRGCFVEAKIMPIVLILVGCFFLIRNLRMLGSDEAIEKYLQTSPKGRIWLDKYGMEKSIALSRKVFLPLGSVVSLGLAGYGIWLLIARSGG